MGINYITAEEAAAILGLKIATIYHRIHIGTLEAIKVSNTDKRNKWLINRAAVEKIITEKQLINADIYTQSEYARMTGQTRQAVFRLIQCGALQTVTIDGRRMVAV